VGRTSAVYASAVFWQWFVHVQFSGSWFFFANPREQQEHRQNRQGGYFFTSNDPIDCTMMAASSIPTVGEALLYLPARQVDAVFATTEPPKFRRILIIFTLVK